MAFLDLLVFLIIIVAIVLSAVNGYMGTKHYANRRFTKMICAMNDDQEPQLPIIEERILTILCILLGGTVGGMIFAYLASVMIAEAGTSGYWGNSSIILMVILALPFGILWRKSKYWCGSPVIRNGKAVDYDLSWFEEPSGCIGSVCLLIFSALSGVFATIGLVALYTNVPLTTSIVIGVVGGGIVGYLIKRSWNIRYHHPTWGRSLIIITGIALVAAVVFLLMRPSVETLFETGKSRYETENFAGAVKYFTVAIWHSSDNAEFYGYRGRAHFGLQNYDAAIADHSRAIQLDPQNPEHFFNRATANSSKKDFRAAVADYTEAIRLNPNDPRFHNSRGSVHRQMEDYAKAIVDHTKAIELNPSEARYHNNRGVANFLSRNYRAAVRDYREAVRLAPDNLQYQENLRQAEEELRKQQARQRRR